MSKFTWVPFYEELADKLLPYRDRQRDIIEYLNGLRSSGLPITPFTDRDANNAELPLEEIDPFTFFAVFNRKITESNRFKILAALRTRFAVSAPTPTDITGIPVLHPMNSWFFGYKKDRPADAIARLWDLFERALAPSPLQSASFAAAFDTVVEVGSAGQVTIGLYWVRPTEFLPLDRRTRELLGVVGPIAKVGFADYRQVVERVRRSDQRTPYEISLDAYDKTSAPPPDKSAVWLVGAWWDDVVPQDRTAEFVRAGVWKNGYPDKYLDLVRAMKPGDRIAIKASTTQAHGLPFEYDKAVSKLVIKARGEITANPGTGREVQVEWDQEFEPRDWYFYTYRGTVWRVDSKTEDGAQLTAFIFDDKPQDYASYLTRWKAGALKGDGPGDGIDEGPRAFDREKAVKGLFMDGKEFDALVRLFHDKKNLIIQGAPGVGKTFLAKRLAYGILGKMDDARLQSVQFHQSYSYEDFVQGFRPSLGESGALAFVLRDGTFYEFCRRAQKSAEPHVFVIDEINRANVSRVFGELMVLLEADKRGDKHAMRLAYQQADDPRFYVPENVYVLGLMNVADRSLAVVDYALRRRFAFYELTPQFASARFREWVIAHGMPEGIAARVTAGLQALNDQIAKDPQLGPHFRVGHSYFCPGDGESCDNDWYERVVTTQIGPLLQEYWYDEPSKAEDAVKALLA
jgi:5-methylcytosine-specific restriction protein B